MKVQPLVQDLRIGEDNAESDAELDQYFIRTSAFMDLVDNRSDLVLGPKGSGKSAMARQLARSAAGYSQLADVDMIPAFNLAGDVLFRRLVREVAEADEDFFQVMWTAYTAGLIGNHVVERYSSDKATRALRRDLDKAGVLNSSDRPDSVWARVVELSKRIAPRRIDGGLTVDELGRPMVLGSVEFDRPDWRPAKNLSLRTTEWTHLLKRSVDVLERAGRRCWVLFDRLDEAFGNDRAVGRVALRGLLRAHVNHVGGHSETVRRKVFLRTDLLHTITRGVGFVNLTHLRRQEIVWDTASIVDLVARRLAESELVTGALGFGRALTSADARRDLCYKVLPRVAPDAMTWIINHTVDSSDTPSPRNVITLLREARRAQLRICDMNDPDLKTQGTLIADAALDQAWRQTSAIRLQDTIWVEFPQLQPVVERLRQKAGRYTPANLANLLGMSENSSEFLELVDDMQYAGLLRKAKTLSIPLLYRPGLALPLR